MKLVYLFFLCMCFQVQAQDWVQVTSLPNAFNETHHSFAFSFDDMGYIVAGNSDSGMRDDFYGLYKRLHLECVKAPLEI